MKNLRVLAVTTSRADYGLLYPLLKKMGRDSFFQTTIGVTGTHLSLLHGKTIDIIKKDGFENLEIVEMTMTGDSEPAICNSIGLGVINFSNLYKTITPDLIIVLGDRYELWAVGIAAVIHKIPLAHIHGGESTFGLIDDSVRHSITKMASLHFPSIDLYAKRIIQMGEDPQRVFTVGALGIDNIKNVKLMSIDELNDYTGVDFIQKVALMTYHPVTLDDYDMALEQIKIVLNSLLKFDFITLITMPNADTGGVLIYDIIKNYCTKYPAKFKLIKNLGQRGYLSAMKYARLMVGNSSSGIIESASFQLPVVNIGDRQAGRFKPHNVIDCKCTVDDIEKAIQKALSEEFQSLVKNITNPYGDGNTADRIIKIIKEMDLSDKSRILKKGFYDICF